MVVKYDYEPFGRFKETTGSTIKNAYTFTGREWDAETGLYFYRARYMDSKIGRFIEKDPIGLRGGINLYAYAGNNPVNLTDPSGLDPFVVTVNYSNSQYGSVTMVWNNGLLPSVYTSGTIGSNGTNIQSGIYTYQYGQHPMNPAPGQDPYSALNLYTSDGSRTLPATRTDGGNTATGINVHSGNPAGSRRSGSRGCHVIPRNDWNDFINQFSPGDTGAYIYFRLW
jgi:RHS repeat-associated protein